MFTLDDDTGAITIDFTKTDPENPTAEPEVVKVVVDPPPSMGAYKRLRAEIVTINRGRDELTTQLREDEKVGVNEMTSLINEYTEDHLLGWWILVLLGDDTYRSQVSGARPPEDTDTWPLYLVANESMQQALAHWKTVPLAHGAQPAQTTT